MASSLRKEPKHGSGVRGDMRFERLAGGQAPVEWLEACLFIARALPQHFTPQGLADMESDLRRAETYVATGAVVGAFALGVLTAVGALALMGRLDD